MLKLSEIRGEDALDLIADIIEPLGEILTDDEVVKLARTHAKPITLVKPMIKNHKSALLSILARLSGQSEEEYAAQATVMSLPADLLALLNDPDLKSLFPSPEQRAVTSSSRSGSATANTEDAEN